MYVLLLVLVLFQVCLGFTGRGLFYLGRADLFELSIIHLNDFHARWANLFNFYLLSEIFIDNTVMLTDAKSVRIEFMLIKGFIIRIRKDTNCKYISIRIIQICRYWKIKKTKQTVIELRQIWFYFISKKENFISKYCFIEKYLFWYILQEFLLYLLYFIVFSGF